MGPYPFSDPNEKSIAPHFRLLPDRRCLPFSFEDKVENATVDKGYKFAQMQMRKKQFPVNNIPNDQPE